MRLWAPTDISCPVISSAVTSMHIDADGIRLVFIFLPSSLSFRLTGGKFPKNPLGEDEQKSYANTLLSLVLDL